MKPTILVQYKAKSSHFGLLTLIALLPVWGVWAPCRLFLFLSVLLQNQQVQDQLLLWNLVLLFAVVILVSIFSLLVCVQNKFALGAQGITFPARCLLELKGRLFRSWQDLESVHFIDSSVGAKEDIDSTLPDRMILSFRDKARLPLELAAFKREDLQNFILAIQSYLPELPSYPPISEVQLGVSVENTAQKAISFTQIWEDDMASRFGSTVFIPLDPGSKLQNGRLEILGQIAFGGLSAIYLAKDSDEELCVIKEAVLPSSAEAASREKALEMFKRESQILMGLKHPKIARVMDYFVEDGRHYMRLEYIDGKDLRRFVKDRGPQSEATVLRWTREIAEILKYLHSLSPPIVHRDLTPDNIVLQADGSLALIDFGAANQFIENATGTLVGKQAYISPEQFRAKASPMSDIYSLGACMYFLLTGTDPEALSVSHPRERAKNLSAEIDSLVARLTALETEQRPLCASAVQEECSGLLVKVVEQNFVGG